jgi:L-ascorbate metabolism protein UlaG (beta-lactamase superfamily)
MIFAALLGPAYGGMPNGVVMAVEGLATVYHAGDTDVLSDLKLIAQLFTPEICILPIGDPFTMGVRGAALAAEMLQPAAIIPGQYRTFPILAQSADSFREALPPTLRVRLVVPDVGEVLTWTAAGVK